MATTDTKANGLSDDEPRRDRRMTFVEHFKELRRRLMFASIGLVIGMIIAAFATDFMLYLLGLPLDAVNANRGTNLVGVNATGIMDGFNIRFRMAFVLGIVISSPIWLWQIWAFVMPAMTKKEIRYTIGFVCAAVPLFFAGATVGILVVPHIIEVMANFVPENMAYLVTISSYYELVLRIVLAIGIAFVIPVLLVGLNLAGVVSGRDIFKGWRIAVLVSTIFAGFTTPAADVISMLLLALLLTLLYVAAASLAVLFDRRKRKRAEKALAT